MARRPKELDLGADQKEHQITETLDKKRRQLDQEIAEFKEGKEHEYRVLERQLRGKTKEKGVQDVSKNQYKRGRLIQKNPAAEAGPCQKEVNDAESGYVYQGHGQKEPRSDVNDLIAALRSRFNLGVSPDLADRHTEASHEREKGFRGNFRMSHVPGVADIPDEGSRSKELLQSPSLDSGDLSGARNKFSAMLSSSAETVHPPMTSPPLPPTRPLSSSVPPEESSHHRRDSSRSDSSIASLRSSLRDPKQPRSPKRVLFSINDTLVSPSTSPLAQRSKSTTHAKPAKSADDIGVFEGFEVIKNGNDRASHRSQSNDVNLSSSSALANGWTASLSTFDRATESNLPKPSSAAGGADDFEHLESDDIFTFDEHMGRAGETKSRETDLEDEFGEDEEVGDEKSRNPPTASSPHAGSLPIEIKWPGRRDDRD